MFQWCPRVEPVLMARRCAGSRRPDLIAAYLARRDFISLSPAVVSPADVLVLCGSAVLAAIDVTATAFHDGLADRLLVTGALDTPRHT